MSNQLTPEAARQLVEQQGTRIAQEIYRRTFDANLLDAIAEKIDQRIDQFSQYRSSIEQKSRCVSG